MNPTESDRNTPEKWTINNSTAGFDVIGYWGTLIKSFPTYAEAFDFIQEAIASSR